MIDLETYGGELIAAIIDSEDPGRVVLDHSIIPELFRGEEKDAWIFATEHAAKHGQWPNRKTFAENGYELPEVEEPVTYHLERVEYRHAYQAVVGCMGDVKELLEAKKAEEALERMREVVAEQLVHAQRAEVISVNEQLGPMVQAEVVQKIIHGKDIGVRTGWPTLDRFNFGMRAGDFYTLVGGTGSGKTWNLLWSAHHAWKTQNRDVMIVTNEILPLEIMNRLAAIDTRVPFGQLSKASFTTAAEQKFSKGLALVSEHKAQMWLVDGNMTATVGDLVALTRYLRPEAVYVDGAYMMRPSGNQRGWEAVVDVARGLKKDVASALRVPVFATYQFNRNAIKEAKKKGESAGMEHVAGSQEIAWLSSVMLALTLEQSAETADRKMVEVLKGRNGETGRFWTHFCFDVYPYMDFSEVDLKTDEMTFD